MLTKIIVDKNKAWGKDLERDTSKFLVDFNEKVINEINSKRNEIQNENELDFPILTEEIKNFKKNILIDGCGFFVIKGSKFSEFSNEEMKSIFKIISKILGQLLIQNKNNEVTVDVHNLGKSMKTGGRYHHTKEGGSYHTDGCHLYHNFPHYVGLLCINQAKSGGESKFVSAYTIHNQILEKEKILKTLYEKFHIDKRNENEKKKSSTQFEPIFEYENNNLIFRFQKELVEAGHEKMNQPLSTLQKESIEELNRILSNSDNAVTYRLQPYDLMFSNNKWLIHDRNGFIDFNEDNKKRRLVRTWIRDITN